MTYNSRYAIKPNQTQPKRLVFYFLGKIYLTNYFQNESDISEIFTFEAFFMERQTGSSGGSKEVMSSI